MDIFSKILSRNDKIKLKDIVNKIKQIITSRYFLIAFMALFVLQATFYAAGIRYGVPPDEKYHFESIAYYSQESFAKGPFIDNQSPETISEVRTLERNTSYLFHYLLSLPLRVLQSFSVSHELQVLFLRLLNVLFALGTLYVLKRCLDEISDDKILKNLSIAAVSLTGMFIWLAGSINYDNLANLLFIAFIWQAIRSIKNPSIVAGLIAISLGMATVLTKYTFLPEILFGITAIVFFLFRKYGTDIKGYYDNLKKSAKLNKAGTITVIVLFVFITLLFAERVGVNVLRFHQVQPSCTKIHAFEECMQNPIFKRNYDSKQAHNSNNGGSIDSIDPFSHTGSWLYKMYNGLYFYFGHKRIDSNKLSELIAAAFVTLFVTTLFFSRKKIRRKHAFWFLAAITFLYVAALYLFNLKTLLSYGDRFAYQGRYLLPVIGFIYFFAGFIIINTARNMSSRLKKIFLISWLVCILLMVIVHFPSLVFFNGDNDTWYNDNFLKDTSSLR